MGTGHGGRVSMKVSKGWHDAQVMPNPKPAMGDWTLHSVSVVVVVSERLGENHFSRN